MSPFPILAFLAVLASGAATTAVEEAAVIPEPQLGRLYYETWLEEVAPLLSREERRAFRALASDSEREDFIQFFWQARETSDGSGRGFWTQNLLHASRAYGDLIDDRVRVLLLLGPPSFEVSFACSWLLVETRIFFYAAGVDREGLYVPFVRDDDETGAHRLWSSSEGILSLVRPPSQKTSTEERAQRYRLGSETASRKTGIAERYRRKQGGSDAVRLDTMIEMIAEGEICPADDTSDPRRRLGLLRAALESDLDWADLRERSEVGAARPDWLDDFRSRPAAPSSEDTLRPTVQFSFAPGLPPSEPDSLPWTTVRARLEIPAGSTMAIAKGEGRANELLLRGDFLQKGVPVDRFVSGFRGSAEGAEQSQPTIHFYRSLEPGDYLFHLRIESADTSTYSRVVVGLTVPRLDPRLPDTSDLESLAALGPRMLSAMTGATVEILTLDGLWTGRTEIEARVAGTDIGSLRFELDGEVVSTLIEPPYRTYVDLGALPKPHRLRATVRSHEGEVLARDEISINAGGHAFEVRIIEPRSAQHYGAEVEVRLGFNLPDRDTLDRIEIHVDGGSSHTLYSRPWIQTIRLPASGGPAVVRALAFTREGRQAEDAVVVNMAGDIEEIDVDMVEIFATVQDRKRRPLTGLGVDSFRVLENGREQQIQKVERIDDLPIYVAVMLDTSGSMEPKIRPAREAAHGFFSSVLKEGDQAAFITFNHRPQIVVPFTGDLQWLADGTEFLPAWGGTVLNDSLVLTLHYLQGLPGRRALVLLTDGHDEDSRFDFETVLDFARRAEVAIYPVDTATQSDRVAPPSTFDMARARPRGLLERENLEELAKETGGVYLSGRPKRLEEAFRRIEADLRSQYLVVYQSSAAEDDGNAFREVEVSAQVEGKVRPRVRAMRGYYP